MCLDSAAETSVCGFHQIGAPYRSLFIVFDLEPSPVPFRFENGADLCLGIPGLRIPLPNGTVILLRADLVRAYVPVRLGLDLMKNCRLVLYFDKDELRYIWPQCLAVEIYLSSSLSKFSSSTGR